VPHPFRLGFLAFALALSLIPWSISRAAAASAPSIQLLQPGAAGGTYTVGSARGGVQLTTTDVDGTIARISWHSDRLDPSPAGACYIDPAEQTVLTWCGMYLMPGVNVITITVEDNDGLTNDAVITIELQKPTSPGAPTVTFSVPDPEIVFTTSSIMNMNTVMTDGEGFVQWFLYHATGTFFTLSGSFDPGTPETSSRAWDYPDVPLVVGWNILEVQAEDNEGHHSPWVTRYVYRMVRTPAALPSIAITSPSTSSPIKTKASAITVSGTGIDPNGGISFMKWESNFYPYDSRFRIANVRQSTPNEEITWTANIPLKPGENRIAIMATDDEGHETTAQLTVIREGISYYLAEGATGFFQFDVLLGNPNDVEAPISVQFLDQNGPLPPLPRTLPPNSRTTIHVNSLPGMESRAVSTIVTSTLGLPLMVERTMQWDERAYAAATDHASEGLSTKWYFAEGAQGFFHTYLLLANPDVDANVAHVTYFREGAGPVTRDYPLKAWARETIDIGSDPDLRYQAFGTEVTFDHPGVAERAMYFGGPPQWLGGHESAGVTRPSRDWFLAEGATGDYWVTFILFANPSPTETAHVDVSFLRTSGEPVTKRYEIGPQQRQSINIAAQDARLVSAAVGTEVHADVPILVERAQYWGGHSPDAWLESHNSFGVIEAAKRWGLAEGRIGRPSRYQPYILIANPGDQAASVTVKLLRENGKPPVMVGPFSIDAKSRKTVFGDIPVSGLENENFSAVIDADQPIVVERAMYSDALGQHWKAGTNATATRLP
jgi:hypothetical protein